MYMICIYIFILVGDSKNETAVMDADNSQHVGWYNFDHQPTGVLNTALMETNSHHGQPKAGLQKTSSCDVEVMCLLTYY